MMSDSVLLIDSYAQIYRSFHAVRDLTSADGTPINAVFALARFLLKLENEFPTELGAFVFDKGKPPRRMAILPEYKANRPPMPESLRIQIPIIREMISLFGWNLIESEGYEADDLLASIAEGLPRHNISIFSADKDIAQVIDDRVTMMVPGFTGGFRKRDAAEVMERFGVRPDQIIPYLALLGDSADNIPGVEGVGPKTAAQLLTEFDTAENLFASLDKIPKEKLRQKLADSKEIFFKNVELVRLDKTPPEGIVWEESMFRKRTPDWTKIAELCKQYSLKSILKELPAEALAECEPPEAAEEFDLFSLPPSAPVKEEKPKDPEPENDYEQLSLF